MNGNLGPAYLILPLLSGGLTLWLTGWVLSFAHRRSMLDLPSDRSSHSLPTPRGGGLAVVVGVLAAVAVGFGLAIVPLRLAAALGGGGLLVAWVGWQDDRRGVPARIRALVQCLAAVWAVAWLGGYPRLAVAGPPIGLGVAGSLVAVVGIVWAVNLFNFMDGIDGLAGGEAVTVAGTGAVLFYLGRDAGGAVVSASVATAALAFLRWNWMPARIFLGDVGSNFLGFALAVLAIWSENSGGAPAILWGLAALVFVADATITLLRRLARGENLVQAHRSHAYQRLVQCDWSHASVSAGVIGLNLLLGGIAVWGYWRHVWPVAALAVGLLLCGGVYLMVERRRPM